jgi:hypothetical protein
MVIVGDDEGEIINAAIPALVGARLARVGIRYWGNWNDCLEFIKRDCRIHNQIEVDCMGLVELLCKLL